MANTSQLTTQGTKCSLNSPPADIKDQENDEKDKDILASLRDAIASPEKELLSFFKTNIELPKPFIALAIRIAQHIQAKRPGTCYRAKDSTVKGLLNYVSSLLNTDSSRLEAAVLTLHGLSLVVACPKGTATRSSTQELWEQQWRLLSEENRTLMRESLELFRTMCEPACRPLTLWFFEDQLSHRPHFPFSALLGRFTPAHVRASDQHLATVLTKAKSHSGSLTCTDFKELSRDIPRPPPKRKRNSLKRPPTFRQRGNKVSRNIAAAVLIVAEAMDREEQEQFLQLAEKLPTAPLMEDGMSLLTLPGLRKRLKLA